MSTLKVGMLLGGLIVLGMFRFLKTAGTEENEENKRKRTLNVVIVVSLGLFTMLLLSPELFVGTFLGLLASSMGISLWMRFFS